MSADQRLRLAISSYKATTGNDPKFLILDSFIHERLRLEHKEGPEDTIGELKNFYGTPVFLLRDGIIL